MLNTSCGLIPVFNIIGAACRINELAYLGTVQGPREKQSASLYDLKAGNARLQPGYEECDLDEQRSQARNAETSQMSHCLSGGCLSLPQW
jgi:hypothetical protein